MSYKGYIKTVLQRPIDTQQARLPSDSGILRFIRGIFRWEVWGIILPPIRVSSGISARLNGILVPCFDTSRITMPCKTRNEPRSWREG